MNTKDEILNVALNLFAVNGYEGVSVKDIADKLSITKGALYRHYESKRDIFDSIIKKMEAEDEKRALSYEVPLNPSEDKIQNYNAIENLIEFSKAQLEYWTQNKFACSFRRMLTIEQFRNAEINRLYNQYICTGPLGYCAEIFEKRFGNNSMVIALNLYSILFLLYSIFDENENYGYVADLLDNHLNKLKSEIKVIEKEN